MLPGDTINLKQRSFVRLATALVPVMDEIIIECQYFFVPLRIIWEVYPKFMGAQENADDSIDFTVPQFTSAGGQFAHSSLSGYLGIPLTGINLVHSALYHRTYNKIYNDWYRDPNLQDKIAENTGLGPDAPQDYTIKRRGKRKDMFTSCLPWPQRGDPITLLFDGIAPIQSTGVAFRWEDQSGNETKIDLGGLGWESRSDPDTIDTNEDMKWGSVTGLEADLSAASANTINGLRNAFSVQRLLERDARGGARLTEILRSHFKVVSPDARLQRPEYLGEAQ